MKLNNHYILRHIFSLNRHIKIIIAVLTDILICIFTVWFAFYLRLENFILLKDINLISIITSIIIAIPIFWILGMYRTLFRHAGLSILFTISFCSLIYGIIYFFIFSIYGVKDVPRSIGIIQPILLFVIITGSRFAVKYLSTGSLNHIRDSKEKDKILIYGAGNAGQQLLLSLENNSRYETIGFLDDNPQIQDQNLLGKKIYNPNELDRLKQAKVIDLILFAIPSLSKLKKDKIITYLNKKNLVVKTLPNLIDIIDEKISISDVKDYLVDDLLMREPIKADKQLLIKNINSKVVLVTGAGGTIGSELCRQIIKLKPITLILLELNEFALYKAYEEFTNLKKNLKIIPLLGNVQDQKVLEKIFKTFKVDTIYHSAAYKHVPLVEANICEGVKNNIFGTLAVAKASINQNVKNFVLISSDKAVRPTNIMGVSKRFAELCIQALSENCSDINTVFSIVRFGNVINSSGSVIPKFRRQIQEGGPITLTHPEVTRYFMTISEAAQLVIQAGALGRKSEVFVLDMGESVKIIDLIKRMVNFSGLKLKEQDDPHYDIEIKIIGLRPGEKLYEELLTGDNPKKTIHQKIKKIEEPYIPYTQLERTLDELKIFINNSKADKVKKLLEKSLKLYNSPYEMVDHIYLEDYKSISKDKNLIINDNQKNIVKLKK